MLDFQKLLLPQQRRLIDNTHHEMVRLYNLTDRWLAEELLRLARRARNAEPHYFAYGVGDDSYNGLLVWHLMPEIARRLGATRLMGLEAIAGDLVGADAAGLRHLTGHCLQHQSFRMLAASNDERPTPFYLLGNAPANGNPIAIALDRACPVPGIAPGTDWIARHLREISSVRGFEPTSMWRPELQQRQDHLHQQPEPEQDQTM